MRLLNMAIYRLLYRSLNGLNPIIKRSTQLAKHRTLLGSPYGSRFFSNGKRSSQPNTSFPQIYTEPVLNSCLKTITEEDSRVIEQKVRVLKEIFAADVLELSIKRYFKSENNETASSSDDLLYEILQSETRERVLLGILLLQEQPLPEIRTENDGGFRPIEAEEKNDNVTAHHPSMKTDLRETDLLTFMLNYPTGRYPLGYSHSVKPINYDVLKRFNIKFLDDFEDGTIIEEINSSFKTHYHESRNNNPVLEDDLKDILAAKLDEFDFANRMSASDNQDHRYTSRREQRTSVMLQNISRVVNDSLFSTSTSTGWSLRDQLQRLFQTNVTMIATPDRPLSLPTCESLIRYNWFTESENQENKSILDKAAELEKLLEEQWIDKLSTFPDFIFQVDIHKSFNESEQIRLQIPVLRNGPAFMFYAESLALNKVYGPGKFDGSVKQFESLSLIKNIIVQSLLVLSPFSIVTDDINGVMILRIENIVEDQLTGVKTIEVRKKVHKDGQVSNLTKESLLLYPLLKTINETFQHLTSCVFNHDGVESSLDDVELKRDGLKNQKKMFSILNEVLPDPNELMQVRSDNINDWYNDFGSNNAVLEITVPNSKADQFRENWGNHSTFQEMIFTVEEFKELFGNQLKKNRRFLNNLKIDINLLLYFTSEKFKKRNDIELLMKVFDPFFSQTQDPQMELEAIQKEKEFLYVFRRETLNNRFIFGGDIMLRDERNLSFSHGYASIQFRPNKNYIVKEDDLYTKINFYNELIKLNSLRCLTDSIKLSEKFVMNDRVFLYVNHLKRHEQHSGYHPFLQSENADEMEALNEDYHKLIDARKALIE